MTDLIGRLRDMANLVGEPAKSTLWEAIAVLEAPLPDDLIKKTVQWLDHWAEVHGCDDVATCARVMERLARENEIAHASQNNAWLRYEAQGEELKQTQQRIEELEQAPLPEDVNKICTALTERPLLADLQEAVDLIKRLWRMMDAEQRIEELEYKLGEAIKIAEREVNYRKRLETRIKT